MSHDEFRQYLSFALALPALHPAQKCAQSAPSFLESAGAAWQGIATLPGHARCAVASPSKGFARMSVEAPSLLWIARIPLLGCARANASGPPPAIVASEEAPQLTRVTCAPFER